MNQISPSPVWIGYKSTRQSVRSSSCRSVRCHVGPFVVRSVSRSWLIQKNQNYSRRSPWLTQNKSTSEELPYQKTKQAMDAPILIFLQLFGYIGSVWLLEFLRTRYDMILKSIFFDPKHQLKSGSSSNDFETVFRKERCNRKRAPTAFCQLVFKLTRWNQYHSRVIKWRHKEFFCFQKINFENRTEKSGIRVEPSQTIPVLSQFPNTETINIGQRKILEISKSG